MTLTRTQYLRLSTLVPFAAIPPAVVLVFVSETLRIPDWLAFAAVIGAFAPGVFGIPYIVFAAGTLLVLRRRSWRAHAWAAVLAPVVMTLALPAISAIARVEDTSEWLSLVPICLATGYAYVGLAALGGVVLAQRGYIAAE